MTKPALHLLISTPLHLLLLDPVSEQYSILRSGDGYYFGITFKEGTVILTHSGGYLQYFRPHAKPWMTISNLGQPHQVEWVDENILVANTGRNCISVFDSEGLFCKDVYLNSIRWDDKDRNREGNHFNSIHREGDRIYVVAHNYKRPSEVWTLSWPELKVIEQKVTGAGWAHNVWIGEKGMVICDSKNGGLHEVLSGKTIWKSEDQPVMTRGLAVSNDHIFVGRSLYNERKDRYWKDGGVWVLNRKTLQVVKTIPLPGVGDVQEIRLVGSPDACHNGETINLQDLAPLQRHSPVIEWAYRLRKQSPSLRRNSFPMSQIVRIAQMTGRMRNSLYRTVQNNPPGTKNP
jgi:hypothetical protein